MSDKQQRVCSTETLVKLIRKDNLCDAYGSEQLLRPGAKHLVIMKQAFVHVDGTREISVSRVTVHARWSADRAPSLVGMTFDMDIPHKDFEKLATPF